MPESHFSLWVDTRTDGDGNFQQPIVKVFGDAALVTLHCASATTQEPLAIKFSRSKLEGTEMRFRFSFRSEAWWQVLFPALALICVVAFVLVPGCYHRWHG